MLVSSAEDGALLPHLGPELRSDGGVVFRLFAPAVSGVRLALNERAPTPCAPIAMHSRGDGWYELAVDEAGPGALYRFVLPDGTRVPDPAARYAPFGVHGPSEVIDPEAYKWNDAGWRGRAWPETVLYELHVGTFTPQGTFRAAAGKLEFLRDLGVTAIELMCLAAFAGERSWGYDSVQIYAPDATYGRPEDLKALIDAAHACGIMVILDVVYNHFGPEGNYIPRYFPQIFSEEHKTAWGQGLNFDGPHSCVVRDFIVQNAIYWMREFHVDGLRIDASHALIDNSSRHILNELSERVHAAAGDRHIHLILENERGIEQLLKRNASGRAPYAAQWNHAVDHMLGLAMIHECNSVDQARLHDTEELARALAEGFLTGDVPCADDEVAVPPTAFVSFIQTHDLIGNRPFGERIHMLASPQAVRAAAAVSLLLPQIPMLFMGEEWAASSPFLFFSDYAGDLGEAVRQGRTEQMRRTSHLDAEALSRAPDPQAESTFLASKLHWEEVGQPSRCSQVEWYRSILAARREHIVPLLSRLAKRCGTYRVHGVGQFECEWTVLQLGRLRLRVNLCSEAGRTAAPIENATQFWLEGTQNEAGNLGPWSVCWDIGLNN